MSYHYTREAGPDGTILTDDGPAPGVALAELLQRGPPPLKAALEIGSAVADILTIAEEDQVVHGDIKPGNIKVDASGAVSVEDFGVPRRTTRAPEGRPVGPTTDVFGLGVILHSLMSKEPLGYLPRDPDDHDDAVVDRVLQMDFSAVEGKRWVEDVRRFLCQILAHDHNERPEPLDAANVLANVGEVCPGMGLDRWAASAIGGGRSAPRPPSQEALGGPSAFQGPLAAGTGGFQQKARVAPSSKGESTAMWSREKIAALLSDEDEEWVQQERLRRSQNRQAPSAFEPAKPEELPRASPVLGGFKPAPAAPAPPVAGGWNQSVDRPRTPPTSAPDPGAARPLAPPRPVQPPAAPTWSPAAAVPPAAVPPAAAPPAAMPPAAAPPAQPGWGAQPPPAAAPPAQPGWGAQAPPQAAPAGQPGWNIQGPAAPQGAPPPQADTGWSQAPPPVAEPAKKSGTGRLVMGLVALMFLGCLGVSGAAGLYYFVSANDEPDVGEILDGTTDDAKDAANDEPAEDTAIPDELDKATTANDDKSAKDEPKATKSTSTKSTSTKSSTPKSTSTKSSTPKSTSTKSTSTKSSTPKSTSTKTTSSSSSTKASSSTASSGSSTPAEAVVPTAGGEFTVKITVNSKGQATVRCGDGQMQTFTSVTRMTFTSTQSCIVMADDAKGVLTASSAGSQTCAVTGGDILCR